MRDHIPRICAGVVVLAFFLPWVKADLGPMGDVVERLAELTGEEMPDLSLSGYDWATDTEQADTFWSFQPATRPTFLFALLASVIAAGLLHQKRNYVALGILAGASLIAGPMPASDAMSFSYGFFLTIIGILAMIVSGVIFVEED
jgi:hypothetical protein